MIFHLLLGLDPLNVTNPMTHIALVVSEMKRACMQDQRAWCELLENSFQQYSAHKSLTVSRPLHLERSRNVP
jgi:hypothetical protein